MSTASSGESELIRRCQSGDKEAFTRLCDLYERQLQCVLYRIDSTCVDDLVQETKLRAWERFSQFHGEAFGSWYLRVGRNQAISLGRKKRPKSTAELPEPSEGNRQGILSMLVRKLEESEKYQALADCLDQLNEKDRTIVRGKFELGDDRVLGERLGMATDTLQRRRYKALGQLRDCMKRKMS